MINLYKVFSSIPTFYCYDLFDEFSLQNHEPFVWSEFNLSEIDPFFKFWAEDFENWTWMS